MSTVIRFFMLCVLAAGSAACDLFQQSICLEHSEQVGCHVTMSVTPSRLPAHKESVLTLAFAQPGTGEFLRGLGKQVRLELLQGTHTVALQPLRFAANGTVEATLSADQAQQLGVGMVTVRLSTDVGAVSVALPSYVEPSFAQIWQGGDSDKKWAGLRTGSPSKIVLFEKTANNPALGEFVEYQIQVDQSNLKASQLVSPQRSGLKISLAQTPRVSRSEYFLDSGTDVSAYSLMTMPKPLGPYSIGAASLSLDSGSNLLALVTGSGLKVTADDTKKPPVLTSSLFQIKQLTIADFDADGQPDVLAITATTDGTSTFAAHVLLQAPDGSFAERPSIGQALQPAVNTLSILTGLAAGDLDGDGRPDIIAAAANSISWFRVDSTELPKPLVNIPATNLIRMETVDLNGDKLADLAVITPTGATLYLNIGLQ